MQKQIFEFFHETKNVFDFFDEAWFSNPCSSPIDVFVQKSASAIIEGKLDGPIFFVEYTGIPYRGWS